MDLHGNDTNVEQEKRSEGPIDYHAPNVSASWQINENNLTNTSIGMIQLGNSMVESSACSTAFMADSFCPPIWDQPINGQSLGFCDVNIQNESSTSSSLGPGRAGMGWSPNAILRGGMFLPTVPGMLPQSLPHLPSDSSFIERAARFSCFSGGNFSEMMNPISFPYHLNPYSRGLGPMQGTHEGFGGNGSKSLCGMQSQRHESNMTEVSKEALVPGEHGTEGSPLKNEKKSESFRRSHDEAKPGVDVSGNESDETEFSGRGAQEELDIAAEDSSGNALGSRKRKRTGQDTEHNDNDRAPVPSIETAKDHTEIKRKGDQNPASVSKPGGRHGKQGSQGSDLPKEEYIHVRARRGQATNSHSLAERVRREKISERMKFLQDLVPGCSKQVTGKAVMLDEIINYVQSLQRQVEFLSMKLATVNPRLDFNIEGFLAKDILQPRIGMSSSLAFPPDMTMPFPPLHPSQRGLIQAPLPGFGSASETLRRPINLQSTALCGGFKESASQIPGVWDDELHNVVHMGFDMSAPLNSQDLSGSIPTGHLKAEL